LDATLESESTVGAISQERNSQVIHRAGRHLVFLFFFYSQYFVEAIVIITNNPSVRSTYEKSHIILFIEGNYRDVLVKARDLVHGRHQLITHPLMGSLKPNETPYRSVVVSDAALENTDADSVLIIEEAILVFDRFTKTTRADRGEGSTEKMKEDFREIDLSLLRSALNE
jgi:hypothetical protein